MGPGAVVATPKFKYEVICASDLQIFNKKLNAMVVDGWVVDGDLSIAATPNTVLYAQRMTKKYYGN